MKLILPVVCAVLASCGPVFESDGSSSRYRSFSDSEIADGGTIMVVDDSLSQGRFPNETHATGIKKIEDHLRRRGFKPTTGKPTYIVKLEYGLDPSPETWTYTAKVHMWENVAPSYDYKWIGRGFAVCPPGKGGNDRMWMEATESALKNFPN